MSSAKRTPKPPAKRKPPKPPAALAARAHEVAAAVDGLSDNDAKLVFVDPSTLVESPFHHRTRWGDMKGLTRSVAEQGVIEPIVARMVEAHDDETAGEMVMEIVVGHRRKDAAMSAHLERVKVLVMDLDDEEVIAIQATENLEREDLHPLDEADYFHDLNQRGHDVKMLTRMFTRSAAYIRDRLRLLELCKTARAAFAKDQITEADAKLICRLPLETQQIAAVEARVTGTIATEELAGWIREHAMISLVDVPWSLDDRAMPGGPCTGCAKRTGTQADLFEPIAGADDLCADVPCWRGKMDKAMAIEIQTRADAATVIAGDPGRVFLPILGARPVVTKASGYVDAQAECPHMPGRTWEAAAKLAGATPPVHLAQDQQRRPRILFAQADVVGVVRRAARDADEAAASAPPERRGTTAGDGDPARAQVAAAARARKAKLTEILGAVLEGDAGELAELAVPLCAGHVVSSTAVRTVAAAAKVQPETIIGMNDESARRLGAGRVLVALLVAEVGVSEAAEVRAFADHYSIEL